MKNTRSAKITHEYLVLTIIVGVELSYINCRNFTWEKLIVQFWIEVMILALALT